MRSPRIPHRSGPDIKRLLAALPPGGDVPTWMPKVVCWQVKNSQVLCGVIPCQGPSAVSIAEFSAS